MTQALSYAYPEVEEPRRSRPWLIALFVAIAFILAEHNWDASQKWRVTVAKDVQVLANAVEGGTARRQIGFAFLGAIAVWGIMIKLQKRITPDLASAYPLLALVVWSLASVAWSIEPSFTAKRLVIFAFLVFSALAIVRHYTVEDLAFIAFAVSLFYLVGGALVEFAIGGPRLKVSEYRFAGTVHPNLAATNGIILTLCSLYFFDRTRMKRFLLIGAIAFLSLLLTRSRTSLAAGVLGIGVFCAMRWPPKLMIAGALIAVNLFLVTSILRNADLMPGFNEAMLLNRKDSDASTLTGRTDIWAYALKEANREPTRFLVGHGFQGFWNTEHAAGVSAYVKFKIAEGHSAYIDSLLNLGAVGLMLFAITIWTTFFRSLMVAWKIGSLDAAFCAGMTGFMVIHSFAESAMIDPHFSSYICFVMLGFAALRRFDAKQELPQ